MLWFLLFSERKPDSVTRFGVLFSFKNLALTLAWPLVVSDSGK